MGDNLFFLYSTFSGKKSEMSYIHSFMFQKFNISTLGEYADLYLKTDVLLLADVFENFRITFMETYRLDPAHYYTAPGLAWDAMLKETKKELTLLTEPDMYNFIELGVRGGVSQCSQRYGKANNPDASGYDKATPTTYLQYYDVNNLYGRAMQQHLPYDGFKWVDPDIMPKDFWRVDDDSPIGYILEVDLAYPRNLHNTHKDLPFCPENRVTPGRFRISSSKIPLMKDFLFPISVLVHRFQAAETPHYSLP